MKNHAVEPDAKLKEVSGDPSTFVTLRWTSPK